MNPIPFLLALALFAATPAHAAPPDAGETDWGRMRRDVDNEARRFNGDFEARRQAIRERARARFAEADANGDKQLSRDELGKLRPALAQHFDRIDSNGDGQASEVELRDAFRKRQQMRRERGELPPGGNPQQPMRGRP